MGESKKTELTEEQILKAPEAEYMSPDQLEFFKNRLLELHDSICERVQEARQRMDEPMEFSDPNDRASREEQSYIELRIIEREQNVLPKIQKSLERIRLGTYGYCKDSGEPIGIPRLLVRPTAEYCAEVKTLKEIKEHHYNN